MPSIVCTLPNHRQTVRDLVNPGRIKETRIGSVTGFVLYYLIETAEGSASVTVCEHPMGCDESTQRAETWLRHHVPDLKPQPPRSQVREGSLPFV